MLPGQSVVFPVSCVSGEVAIEPRWDLSHNKTSKDSAFWPQAQLTEVVDGAITLQNLNTLPVVIHKSEPVCNVQTSYLADPILVKPNTSSNQASATSDGDPVKQSCIKSNPVNTKSTSRKSTTYSSSVDLNPDGVLNHAEEEMFRRTMSTYDDVFSKVTSTYNGRSGPCHVKVNIGPNEPPQRKGRVPFYGDGGLQELQDYFDDLLARGILSKPEELGITVENINPSFLVNKPVGKRLVTDFKSIAEYCRQSPSLLPNVETTIRRISSYKVIIKTDMSSSYWQIKMLKESMKYCGVHTPFKGILVYNVGSMGLPGVESALEELTCLVLGDMVRDGKVCKLADDLVIGGDSVEEAHDNFTEVLHRFQVNNLKLSPTKTSVAPKSVSILGWVWSAGTLTASPHKLSALASCPEPTTVAGLRSYLGMYRFIARVIQGYATLLAPLEEAVKGKDPKERIQWSDELSNAYKKSQDALPNNKSIAIPHPSDALTIVTDASVRPGAVGATLYAIGENGPKLAGFYNCKLPNFQRKWLPCEVEALAIACALNHFSPYIQNSKHRPQVLTDSKPCVDAAKKLLRGEFSTSARLSTFLSSTSRYNATVNHIPGSLNLVSDYISRHPLECPSPEECAVCKFVGQQISSVVQNVTIEDILQGKARMPWTNRNTWRDIQDECNILRKVKFFRDRGTQPGKKSRNLRQVRKYLTAGVILSHDSVLVNPYSPPLGRIIERIVVPDQIIHGILTMLHLLLNHPTAYNLSKAFCRYFFALGSDKYIKEVSQNCSQCAAIKELPKAMIKESTEPPPSVIGESFAADIIKRSSQKIMCIRETVTSYTLAELISDEKKETVATSLIKLCNLLRPSSASSITVRLDPASAHKSLFSSLQNFNVLPRNNIHLELGRTLNKNKNPVIDKGIKELIREFLILQPEGGPVSPLLLSQAIANLNSRYRGSGMSAQELWTKRDQITGTQLPIADRELIMQQYQTRVANHPKSEKCKAQGKPCRPSADVTVGSLVYVYSDKSKLHARKRYLVTSIQGNNAKIRRFTEQLIGIKEYDVKLEEIYKVPSLEDANPQSEEESSGDEWFMTPQQQDYNSSSENHSAPVLSSEEDADTEGETESGSYSDSDHANDRDLTFRAPANLAFAPAVRRPQRTRKKVDRYGISPASN